MITLTYVTSAASRGRTFKYETLKAAQRHAHKLVGQNPKRDPDGYAVNRVSGNCLFFKGVTFEALFPSEAVPAPTMANNSIAMEDAADAFHELSEEDFVEAVKALAQRRMRTFPTVETAYEFRNKICEALETL